MIDFLDFLHPYGLTELRCIKGTKVVRFWRNALHRSEVRVVAEEYDRDGWDVYVGVLPRTIRDSTGEACWPGTHVLWADVDDKLHEGDHSLSLQTILAFPVPPSVVVDSGHGFHVYWGLSMDVPFSEARTAMEGIARWIGGDHTYDQARILRLPGTTNHKDPEHPIPVRLLKLDHLRKYELSDFAEMTMAAESRKPQRERYQRREDAPDWLKDMLLDEPPKGSRSEAGFRAAMWLSRYGYSDDEILSVLMSSPVGAKAQEKGEKWAERDIARVRGKA